MRELSSRMRVFRPVLVRPREATVGGTPIGATLAQKFPVLVMETENGDARLDSPFLPLTRK